MYDEFESALTGDRARRGLSPLGWIGVGFGLVVLVGVVGMGYAATQVASRARHVARELSASAGVSAARVLSNLQGGASLARLDPDAGLSFLRDLQPGDPSAALVKEVVGNGLGSSDAFQSVTRRVRTTDTRSVTVRSGDGDVHLDLTRGKNGGSLVIDSKDGHVRFDLTKSSRGGTLTIDSDDGHARIDLIRSENGGQLLIRSDDGTVELALGSSSRLAPGWVPRPDGMPQTPRPVFSLNSRGTRLGAVAWSDDASPGDVVASFRKALEKDGYEVQAEESRRGPDGDDASLWAKRDADGRTVFLLARRIDGRTRDVLGYGEGDTSGR